MELKSKIKAFLSICIFALFAQKTYAHKVPQKIFVCSKMVRGFLESDIEINPKLSRLVVVASDLFDSKLRKFFGPRANGQEFVRQTLVQHKEKIFSEFYSSHSQSQVFNERRGQVVIDVDSHEYLLNYRISLFNGVEVFFADDIQIKKSESMSFEQAREKLMALKKIEYVEYIPEKKYKTLDLESEKWVINESVSKTFSLVNAGLKLEDYVRELVFRGPTLCFSTGKSVQECIVFLRRKHRSFKTKGERDVADIFVLGEKTDDSTFRIKKVIQKNRPKDYVQTLVLYFAEMAKHMGLPQKQQSLEIVFKQEKHSAEVEPSKLAKILSLHGITLAQLSAGLKNVFLVKKADEFTFKPDQTVEDLVYELFFVGPQNKSWSAIVKRYAKPDGSLSFKLLSAYQYDKLNLSDVLGYDSEVEFLPSLGTQP